MKAVLQAGWLFTVAVGNFIVLIVAEIAKLPNKVRKKCSTYQTYRSHACAKMLTLYLYLSPCLSPLLPQWAEYVLFASLLVLVCIIFSIMAYFYTYIDPSEIEVQFRKKADDDEDDKDKQQKAEIEMVRRDSAESYDDNYKQSKM